jgi:hypothetical protein
MSHHSPTVLALSLLATLVCAWAFTGTTSRHASGAGRSLLDRNLHCNACRAFGEGDDGDEGLMFGEDEAVVFHKKKTQQPQEERDRLMFDVYLTPPKRKLGTFKLPPLTANGDMIWLRDDKYIVRRVEAHYRYEAGAFRMFKKTAEAAEMMRLASERVAMKMMMPQEGSSSEEKNSDDHV